MMVHKQLLHELLEHDQEPFLLKSYIADKRSQLNHSSPVRAVKRHPAAEENSSRSTDILGRNTCLSSDFRKSPFIDFQSPAIRPCKSPGGAVFLHVPSETAAVLVESAARIKKQQHSKLKTPIENPRLRLFGSFIKILNYGSKNKAFWNHETKEEGKLEEGSRISCSCDGNRPEELDDITGDFALPESRFFSSLVRPFRFSLCRSSSSSGRRSPQCCSPATSTPVRRHVKQEKENTDTGEGSDGIEEEKEQCSPVSVLDPFFEEEGHQSADAEEDEYNLNCSYANLERTKQQLLNRLRRFEELAALDSMDLELKFLEGSDHEFQRETIEPDDDDQRLSVRRRQGVNTSSLEYYPRNMATDMKRLFRDIKMKEKSQIIVSRDKEELGVIDRMMRLELDLGWDRCGEEMEELTADVEVAIFGVLVEELSNDLI